MKDNQKMTYKEIAASTNIPKTSIFRFLHNNLQYHHVEATLSYLRTNVNKNSLMHKYYEWKQMLQNDLNFLRL